MSVFNFDDYKQTQTNSSKQFQKVGWFKLANDGDEALVRMNISSLSDLQFASIHTLSAAANWMRVSCLHKITEAENNCPFCREAANGNTAIGVAKKRVYVQMLVSYKDKATGGWASPVPVIWDRPAGFSKELQAKLASYGNLKDHIFKITRNGAAGSMQTTYTLDYAIPTVFKPELIPADFSAFENFDLTRHSFWVKSEAEMDEFIRVGAFPEGKKEETTSVAASAASVYSVPNSVQTSIPVPPNVPIKPVQETPVQNTGTTAYSNFQF